MNNIDLNYLKYFYFVVTSNGFTKASEVLHVQQPVISRAVKLLELQLGFKLLERQKKQVLLTADGQNVFNLSQKIFAHADQISAYAKDRNESGGGDLCFATSDSLSPDAMGSILKKFKREFPQIRPVHHSGPAQILIDKIQSGTVDFGVFFNVPELPRELDKVKLATVPFDFVILKELSRDREIAESFIATKEQDDDDSTRLPLFQKYKSYYRGTKIVAISSSSVARKDMVLSGLGTTILPRFLIRAELKLGVLKSLHEGDYSLPLYLVERKSSYRSKIKNTLLNLIKETVER
jgi:DNA-binding transcriptional LysR family regulator